MAVGSPGNVPLGLQAILNLPKLLIQCAVEFDGEFETSPLVGLCRQFLSYVSPRPGGHAYRGIAVSRHESSFG
jgi:hypothetical protein